MILRLALTLFLALLLSPLDLLAQTSWVPGQVTLLSGETFSGTVQNRNWKDNVTFLFFRKEGSLAENRYEMEDLTGFNIGQSTYVVQEITFNNSPRETANLVSRGEQEEKTIRGALLLLNKGPVNLYEYTSSRGNRHYFMSKGGASLQYLRYSIYLKKDNNDADVIQRSKEYTFQLNEFLAENCPDLVTKISAVKYERKSMVRLLNDYFDCIGFVSTDRLEKSSPELIFGVSPGISYLSNNLGSEDTSADFETPSGFGLSFGGLARFYFNQRRILAIRGEIRYHQFSFEEKGSRPSSNVLIENFSEHEFTEQSIVGKIGAEFALFPGRLSTNLSFGAAFNQILTWEEKRWIYTRRIDTGQVSGSPTTTDKGGNSFIGPYGGFTFSYGQIGLGVEASYYFRELPEFSQLRVVRIDINASYMF